MTEQDIKYLSFVQRGAEGALSFAANGYELAKRKTMQISPKAVEGMISGTEQHLQPVMQSYWTLTQSVLKLMDTLVCSVSRVPRVRHTHI